MTAIPLSRALEDYLETIYQLVQEQQFARVKEIAQARGVRAASVSSALKKLSDLGLVKYVRREYVTLTEDGEHQGRRVYSRHRLLTRFFEDVLQMAAPKAEEQACALEHHLSDEGMDRLVRFFEFLGMCPSAPNDLLDWFRGCPIVHDDAPACHHIHAADASCGQHCQIADPSAIPTEIGIMTIADLSPGQSGRVTQIEAHGAIRQRLLDMGILPDTRVEIERVGPTGDPVWIKCQGAQLALRRNEADAVKIATK